MGQNPQETVDMVTFNEEILNGKLHFLGSEWKCQKPDKYHRGKSG